MTFVTTMVDHPSFPFARAVRARITPDRIGKPLLGLQVLAVITEAEEFVKAPKRFAQFGGRLVVEMTKPDWATIVGSVQALRSLDALVEFRSESVGDGGVLMMLASLGIRVALPPEGAAPGVLGSLAAYFLESPVLDTPIEPFFSLARGFGASEGDRPTLAELFLEQPGEHLYVDAQGRVTISARLARKRRFLGKLEGGPLPAWQKSPLWRERVAHERRARAKGRPCARCAHYEACRGLLLFPAGDRRACREWLAVMALLQQARATARDASGGSGAGGSR
ncbi:MAG: hypothetical protein HY906_13885 [Deltaproteobacteria bacterium]|nr:hypothetical protein [Deltaproteobacteria bacterium]